jgi:hypothetical protein
MPTKTAARGRTKASPRKAAPAAEVNGERDFTAYADKPITTTMEAFAAWLEEVTGYEVDERSVALGGTLRMDFQKSDWWREHEDNPRNAEDEAPAPRGRAAKNGKAKAAKPDLEDEDEEDEEEAPPTPRARRGTASARTKAKAAPARSGRKGGRAAASPEAAY